MKRLVALMMRLMGKRTCEDVVAVLQDYFEGTLDPHLARLIERHFRDCPDCAAFAHTYNEVIKLAGEVEYVDVPAEVRQRVRRALREHAAPAH
jgi:predicted anti-sigma-YlaC factor YlaD